MATIASKPHYYALHAEGLKQALAAALDPAAVRELHQKRPRLHFLVAGALFLTLALAYAGAVHFSQVWIWLPLAFIEGFCIFDCTVLLHEVVHDNILTGNRATELPTEPAASGDRAWAHRGLAYLYSIPSGISASQFTRWHLDHHAELGSAASDPKRAHLSPKRNRRWLKLLYFTPALFFIYFRAAGRETASYPAALRARIVRERRMATLFHLAVGGLTLGLAGWAAMLRAWAVPVFLVFPIAFALNRLGQHYDINPEQTAEWSTLMKPSWFWNVAFLNSNYHLEHHYFPRVPLYRLPQLGRLLRPFYAERGMRYHTFGELLWKYLVLNRPPHANWDEPHHRGYAAPGPRIEQPIEQLMEQPGPGEARLRASSAGERGNG